MAGHLVVILTVLWMQRSVLTSIVDNRDQDIEVERITKSVFDKKAAQSEELPDDIDSHEVEEITELDDLTEIVEEDTQEMEGNWQQDSTTEWGKPVESISDEIEWNSDVIELDD